MPFVLRGRDNRETVFLTEPVADLAHIIVNPLVALVCVVVHEVNRIENQMVMNMVFVNVSGQHILIFSSEDFIIANCLPISWASSGVTSPISKDWIT